MYIIKASNSKELQRKALEPSGYPWSSAAMKFDRIVGMIMKKIHKILLFIAGVILIGIVVFFVAVDQKMFSLLSSPFYSSYDRVNILFSFSFGSILVLFYVLFKKETA